MLPWVKVEDGGCDEAEAVDCEAEDVGGGSVAEDPVAVDPAVDSDEVLAGRPAPVAGPTWRKIAPASTSTMTTGTAPSAKGMTLSDVRFISQQAYSPLLI